MPSDPLKDLILMAAVLIQRLRDWIEREKAKRPKSSPAGIAESERRIDAWERDIAVLEVLTFNGRHPDELELTLALRGAWRDLKMLRERARS
jgi:hypothetical protein